MSVYLDWDSINWHSCRYGRRAVRYDLNGAETLQTIILSHIMRYLFKYSFIWKTTLPHYGAVLESSTGTLQKGAETAQPIILLKQGESSQVSGTQALQSAGPTLYQLQTQEKAPNASRGWIFGPWEVVNFLLPACARVEQSLDESWHCNTRSLKIKLHSYLEVSCIELWKPPLLH